MESRYVELYVSSSAMYLIRREELGTVNSQIVVNTVAVVCGPRKMKESSLPKDGVYKQRPTPLYFVSCW